MNTSVLKNRGGGSWPGVAVGPGTLLLKRVLNCFRSSSAMESPVQSPTFASVLRRTERVPTKARGSGVNCLVMVQKVTTV